MFASKRRFSAELAAARRRCLPLTEPGKRKTEISFGNRRVWCTALSTRIDCFIGRHVVQSELFLQKVTHVFGFFYNKFRDLQRIHCGSSFFVRTFRESADANAS